MATEPLWSEEEIDSTLAVVTERHVGADEARAILRAMKSEYEADRAAKEQANATLTTQTQSQAATIAFLNDNAISLSDKVVGLTAQVGTLTQDNGALTSQTQSQAATITNLATDKAALTNSVSGLTAQVNTLTQSNANLTSALATSNASNAILQIRVDDLSPDVTVTVDTTSPKTSAFSTAVSHVSTNDLLLGDATARARAEAVLAPALTFHRVSAHSYGGGDPWPWNGTGTRPAEPTNWSNVDSMLQMVARMGGTPIVGFGNWPWHTKGIWNGSTTTPLTASLADALSDDGRPITEQLPTILKFVQRTCERYMVAPYNVRYWQLGAWEFHGFERGRDGTYNNWGYDAYAGSPGQANMGMAYVHNQVSAKIISTAASLTTPIPRNQLKIITNYPPMVAYGNASPQTFPVGHPLYGKPYGAFDKRTVAALLGMLPLLTPGSWDYWSYDQGSHTKDGIVKTDDWTNSQRFTDLGEYLKAQVAALGFGNIPFIVSEEYNHPQADPGANQQQLRAALHAEAFRRFVLLGASMAIVWSTVGRANEPGTTSEAGLHTSVATSIGGQPQPALSVVKLFHDAFPPGTPVYPITGDSSISGLASDKEAVLINKTNSPRKVALGNDIHELAPYGVRKVTR